MSPPEDSAGLDELIQAILEDPGYARGIRKSSRGLTEEEALSVLEAFYRAHDQADEQVPAVAAKLGCRIACKMGCSACCASLVLASTPETRLIARELGRPENHAKRRQFLARAPAWAKRVGALAERAAEAHFAGNESRYTRLMKEHARLGFLCPLNVDGACSVYAVRPLPCRQVWVTGTAEYCMPSDNPGQPEAKLITFDAFEALIAQGRTLSAGMQHVMGEGIRRAPLATALLALLETDA